MPPTPERNSWESGKTKHRPQVNNEKISLKNENIKKNVQKSMWKQIMQKTGRFMIETARLWFKLTSQVEPTSQQRWYTSRRGLGNALSRAWCTACCMPFFNFQMAHFKYCFCAPHIVALQLKPFACLPAQSPTRPPRERNVWRRWFCFEFFSIGALMAWTKIALTQFKYLLKKRH